MSAPTTSPSPARLPPRPSPEIVRTTASFGAPPRRAGLGAPLPPGVSRLPAVQRESAPRPEATAPATGVGGSPSRTSAPAPETGSEPVPSREEPVTPPRRHDPIVPVDDVPPEIAPLVGLRRLPTTMDDGLSTPDEPSATPSDLAATIQRQAASFVTAPNPFRVGAGPEPPTEPPGQRRSRRPTSSPHWWPNAASCPPRRWPAPGRWGPSPRHPGSRHRWRASTPPRPVPVSAASVQRLAERRRRAGHDDRPALGGEHGTAAADPTGFVDAGAVAVAAGLAHRAADGSVVFGPGSPSRSAESRSPASAARVTSDWPTQRQVPRSSPARGTTLRGATSRRRLPRPDRSSHRPGRRAGAAGAGRRAGAPRARRPALLGPDLGSGRPAGSRCRRGLEPPCERAAPGCRPGHRRPRRHRPTRGPHRAPARAPPRPHRPHWRHRRRRARPP